MSLQKYPTARRWSLRWISFFLSKTISEKSLKTAFTLFRYPRSDLLWRWWPSCGVHSVARHAQLSGRTRQIWLLQSLTMFTTSATRVQKGSVIYRRRSAFFTPKTLRTITIWQTILIYLMYWCMSVNIPFAVSLIYLYLRKIYSIIIDMNDCEWTTSCYICAKFQRSLTNNFGWNQT